MGAVLENEKKIINASGIPDDTFREMIIFFQKTSIPRIVEERKKRLERGETSGT